MNALVTGANRGIGLELCRQLAEAGYDVFGACRKASPELIALGVHVLEGMDVGRDESVTLLKGALKAAALDLLVNCAGVLERVTFDQLDFASVEKQIQVNALGPLRVVKAVEEKIVKGGKIIMITSRMGSIADNTSGGSYGYRMSKVALNMASVSLAQDLMARQIAVGIIHPGFVQTAMTDFSGPITVEESAQGILKRIDELTLENSGTFWHQNGEILPW